MATGDILSAVVRADGWSMDVTIEGFTTGATYDFGSLDDTPATVTAPMFSVAVVSEGYSAAGVLGTIARTVYGTHVVRKPYPDQASKDETVSGSDLVVRVALSESIYNDDKNGGAGTSGTDPAVTIAAEWAANTGGAAQTSAVATALACTNNSTLDYPKCIAQWAWGHTPAFRRVTAAFDIGCIAYHGHGIACVALSAVGAVTVSGNVTTKAAHLMSASGLYYESYDLAVPVTGMTDGNDITLRFIAYPVVGDADSIIDTSTDTGATNIAKGLTQITATYKTTAVTVTAGAGGTYATIGAALATSPDIILVKSNIDLLGATPASVTAKSYCIEVMPETGSFTLTRNGPSGYDFKARHLRYSGFTIASAGEAYSLESTAAYTLQFGDCAFTRTGALPGQGIGAETDATIFVNCTWDGRDNFGLGAVYNNSMTGCDVIGGRFQTFHGLVANAIAGTGVADELYFDDRAAGLQMSNYLFLNNEVVNANLSGSTLYTLGNLYSITGAVFLGNLVEVAVVTASEAIAWFEGTTNYASESTIFAHNTVVGQRTNIYYNDQGALAVYHNNAFVRNNALEIYNQKNDLYAPENANRVGAWAQMNGVNYSDNRFDATSGFPPEYFGINGACVTSVGGLTFSAVETNVSDLGFTTNNSKSGTGTGNGDYMPTEASVLYDHTLRQAYQSYDLYGVGL